MTYTIVRVHCTFLVFFLPWFQRVHSRRLSPGRPKPSAEPWMELRRPRGGQTHVGHVGQELSGGVVAMNNADLREMSTMLIQFFYPHWRHNDFV